MRSQFCRCLVLLFVAGIPSLNGQSALALRKELVWSAPGQEIATPQFSPDGNFIVLVTRAYWPDGANAEGLPESFFNKLTAKAKADPRFADPVIKAIALTGKLVCEVQFGWNPSLSPDDKHVVFSEQVKPITGFRGLASPLAGNGIRMYDCGTKELTKIADPDTGYFANPFLSSDGGSIIYSQNEAVNGAFGGSVGIERFDLRENRKVVLVKKESVSAVPCPPAGSSQPGLCSRETNLTGSFPQIVFHVAPVGGDLIALLGMPIPAPGDMYLSQDYDMNLVSVLPQQRTILSLGKRRAESWDNTTFQPASDGRILIFSQYWKLFSSTSGRPLEGLGSPNTKRKSIYSPDLTYYLCAEPPDDPNHFVLYRTADGKRLDSLPKMSAAYEAVWSPESNRFAIVDLPTATAGATHYAEELVVYSVR